MTKTSVIVLFILKYNTKLKLNGVFTLARLLVVLSFYLFNATAAASPISFELFHLKITFEQDGPSLESSSYLNVTLRYLGPWDPLILGLLDLGTSLSTPQTPPHTSSYILLPPPISSYFFLPLSSFSMVWYGGRGGVEM